MLDTRDVNVPIIAMSRDRAAASLAEVPLGVRLAGWCVISSQQGFGLFGRLCYVSPHRGSAWALLCCFVAPCAGYRTGRVQSAGKCGITQKPSNKLQVIASSRRLGRRCSMSTSGSMHLLFWNWSCSAAASYLTSDDVGNAYIYTTG